MEQGNRPAGRRRLGRLAGVAVASVAGLAAVPAATAHGGSHGAGFLEPVHGVAVALAGLAVIAGAALGKRTGRVSPTTALYAAFGGIVLAAVGAVLFDGLSADPVYTAASMPFPRSWYRPMALGGGLLVVVASFLVGWLRWPTRPRYTFLGILLGLWIMYPYLFTSPTAQTHPLGYAIVLGTPVLVGYVVWRDAGRVLAAVAADPVARWFGVGVAGVLVLFFLSITGYMTVFPEAGGPTEPTVVVLPAIYQLVLWPTLEVALPSVPFFLALSPGVLAVVGTLSGLVGLNAAVIARQWRLEEAAGLTEGTAGGAAIVGTCTCGCCGPLVAKLAVLAAGPSVAAPLYWVFVDSASPLSALFLVGSVVLFTGALLYSVAEAEAPGGSTALQPAD